MRYIVDTHIRNFKAWEGGKDTLDHILMLDEMDDSTYYSDLLDCLAINEFANNGIPSEYGINDWLWYDRDKIYEMLGLDEDGEEIE